MLTVYGELMPLRVLEEIRFWKTQEKEHTVVIRALVPNLEPPFARLLGEWEPVFAQTEFIAGQWIEALIRKPDGIAPAEIARIDALQRTAMTQSTAFVQQLMRMLNDSAAIRANKTAPVVVQHIIRESEYFLGVMDAYSKQRAQPSGGQRGEGATWLSRDGPSGAEWRAAADELPADYRADKAPADPQSGSFVTTEQVSMTAVGTPGNLNITGEGSWSMTPLADPPAAEIGGHRLPPLPYAYNALEPHIDEATMKLHHDVHHLGYVNGLNKAETMLAKARREDDYELVKHWEREAAFHGAGHYLHTIFWEAMHPRGGGKPTGTLAHRLEQDFGSFHDFRRHFSQAAEKVEGSGWAILVWSPRSRRLAILQAEKHQNLSQWDVVPLLPLDVWEHAYYLKYRTQRAAYIEAWWNVVNWPYVNGRFTAARVLKWPPS